MAWKDIRYVLEKVPKDTPITSIVLHRLFKGKSVNTPAFLLAVLKHEKLLQPMKGKKRSHELVDAEVFLAKIEKLISTSDRTSTRKTTKKTPVKKITKKTAKKAPLKKKSTASRRK